MLSLQSAITYWNWCQFLRSKNAITASKNFSKDFCCGQFTRKVFKTQSKVCARMQKSRRCKLQHCKTQNENESNRKKQNRRKADVCMAKPTPHITSSTKKTHIACKHHKAEIHHIAHKHHIAKIHNMPCLIYINMMTSKEVAVPNARLQDRKWDATECSD